MRVERVLGSKRLEEIKAIYYASFPKEEQMPFGLMLAMSCLWHTQFLAFYEGETLCGFVYMATQGRQSFIMFFAVEEKLRSKGYGSRILSEIQALYPQNKLIVSIEPCVECGEDITMRIKRKAFYLRNGYQETGYFMKLGGQEQEILIKNGLFDKRQFIRFFMLYSCCTTIPKIWTVK